MRKVLKVQKKNQIHIVVIGAGASGLLAAISAARAGARVTLLEKKEKVGKKILATGNGHCNFTNAVLNEASYHGNLFAIHVIEQFDRTKTLALFQEMGIFPHERNGYYYPASEQAQSVVTLLEAEVRRQGVEIWTDTRVEQIQSLSGNTPLFQISVLQTLRSAVKEKVKKNGKKKQVAGELCYESKQLMADRVILACGGMASPALGSDGSGYSLACSFGHTVVKPLPALTGIRCKESWFSRLAGIRIPARVAIWVDGVCAAQDEGELQLTDYGISGIPVFQVSRCAARALEEGHQVEAELCFYPEISEDALEQYLEQHEESQYRGLYPEKLLQVLLERVDTIVYCSKQNVGTTLSKSTDRTRRKEALRDLTRHLRCTCEAVNGFDRAQVTCGGVVLEEVNPQTLESQKCPGLYLAGELLDVDGICGGYNLQWAWSSGWIAGQSAAQEAKDFCKTENAVRESR